MTTGVVEREEVRRVLEDVVDQVIRAQEGKAATEAYKENKERAHGEGLSETYAPKARPAETYAPKARPSETYAPKARTTFPVRQRTYRDLVTRFFSDEDHYDRLRRLVIGRAGDADADASADTCTSASASASAGSKSSKKRTECDRMCSIIFYYVKEFEPDRLVSTGAGIYRVCDEYNNAITNYKKRYYNFESKEGSGELVWKGKINPPVSVSAPASQSQCDSSSSSSTSVALPLPRLIALYWFIQFGFDRVFWQRFEEVERSYEAFTARVKRKYTDNHKTKKAERRRKFEQEILAQRKQTGEGSSADQAQVQTQAQAQAQAKLTRVERRLVAQKIEQDKERRREMRMQKGHAGGGRGQKRKRKSSASSSQSPNAGAETGPGSASAAQLENKESTRRSAKEIKTAVLIDTIGGEHVTLK